MRQLTTGFAVSKCPRRGVWISPNRHLLYTGLSLPKRLLPKESKSVEGKQNGPNVSQQSVDKKEDRKGVRRWIVGVRQLRGSAPLLCRQDRTFLSLSDLRDNVPLVSDVLKVAGKVRVIRWKNLAAATKL
jgi:hypothetical protein